MTVKSLNHYKGLYDGGATTFCDAQTIVEAAELLTNTEGLEPTLLQKVGTGIKVVVPDAALAFTTNVEETAHTAGCRAYPSGGNVTRGQKLFLSAVAADGYKFIGWYQGDTLLSAEAEAEVVVESIATVPTTIVYEAKFQLN